MNADCGIDHITEEGHLQWPRNVAVGISDVSFQFRGRKKDEWRRRLVVFELNGHLKGTFGQTGLHEAARAEQIDLNGNFVSS